MQDTRTVCRIRGQIPQLSSCEIYRNSSARAAKQDNTELWTGRITVTGLMKLKLRNGEKYPIRTVTRQKQSFYTYAAAVKLGKYHFFLRKQMRRLKIPRRSTRYTQSQALPCIDAKWTFVDDILLKYIDTQQFRNPRAKLGIQRHQETLEVQSRADRPRRLRTNPVDKSFSSHRWRQIWIATADGKSPRGTSSGRIHCCPTTVSEI